MNGNDIGIYESGNGGEVAIINNDLALGDTLLQQAYICLFGGNVEADTIGNEPADILRFDWWGNSLLFGNDTARMFNSQTERALKNNALTSNGRVNIERAVNADLTGLQAVAGVSVAVNIISTDSVQIAVTLSEPGSNQSQTMLLLWDNLKQAVIVQEVI